MATYEQQKASCAKRMIGFTFTKQQWEEFHKLRDKVACAYTNNSFVLDCGTTHLKYPTVERIFDDRDYSPDNCIWVTKEANELKAIYIENGKSTDKLDPHSTAYVKRIKRIIESVDNIKEIQLPYKHLFQEEKKVVEEKVTNPELVIASSYANLGKFVEGQCSSEFQLTYSQFKTLISRKKCMLTQKELPVSLNERRLWVVDKTLPVSKDNVLVTTKELQAALDTMTVSAKLSLKDLQNIGKVLNK